MCIPPFFSRKPTLPFLSTLVFERCDTDDVLLLGLDHTYMTPWTTQPGVADPEMKQLVNKKVDVFWKGIESGSNKRGQVPSRMLSAPY